MAAHGYLWGSPLSSLSQGSALRQLFLTQLMASEMLTQSLFELPIGTSSTKTIVMNLKSAFE